MSWGFGGQKSIKPLCISIPNSFLPPRTAMVGAELMYCCSGLALLAATATANPSSVPSASCGFPALLISYNTPTKHGGFLKMLSAPKSREHKGFALSLHLVLPVERHHSPGLPRHLDAQTSGCQTTSEDPAAVSHNCGGLPCSPGYRH